MFLPFGGVPQSVLEKGRRYLDTVISSGQLTEGPFVREFENKFARKFGWKHAIMVSSGTMAGTIVWAAIRTLREYGWAERESIARPIQFVITPASAFVATANCLYAAGLLPAFVDINRNLNLDYTEVRSFMDSYCSTFKGKAGCVGVQFVMNMGRSVNFDSIYNFIKGIPLDKRPALVVDACEGHGGKLHDRHTPLCADAAIYSFYPAHMIVAGEGGMICTNDERLDDRCRSLKSHGRMVGTNLFMFNHLAYNAKSTDMAAAIGLASLEEFDTTYNTRRQIRQALLDALSKFEDDIILYRDAPGEEIAPHAFPVSVREGSVVRLQSTLEVYGVECKTLFGALPLDHRAFANVPKLITSSLEVAKSLGVKGVHFGCNELIADAHIKWLVEIFDKVFSERRYRRTPLNVPKRRRLQRKDHE